MKKQLLILASLVFGIGQLFADQVTFSAGDLYSSLPAETKKVVLPYTWKTSPYHVTVTLNGTAGENVQVQTTYIGLKSGQTVTVSVGGAGTINGITINGSLLNNTSASTGTFNNSSTSCTWAPAEGTSTSSATINITGVCRPSSIVVDYTPDSGYTPDGPTPTATMGDPIEAIAIDNINTYTGSEPYVYSKANMTYYALNSIGEYEEYGIFTEVNTLKAAGNTITEIQYLKSPSGAYINLGYIPKANSKAICTMIAETGGDWKAAYGCGYYQNGWKDRFCFFTTNATINLGGETGNRDAMAYGRKIVTVLDAVEGKMDIFEEDGVTPVGTITDSPKTADCKTPLYVFAQNKDVPGGDPYTDCHNPFVTIYSLDLYEGDTKVMELVPAVNGEGKGGLLDKLTGTFYGSANSAEFELDPEAQAMASEAGIPVYEGKRVKLTTDNHEYKYQGNQWLDCGEMTLEEIADTNPSYKDMRNWKTNDGHMSIFAGFTYDGTTNVINPYIGTPGHEPYMFQIPTIAGQDYNWTFIYSGSAYSSWHSTEFHAFVSNAYDLGMTTTGNVLEGDIIGIAEAFPFAGVENKPYSIDFTAKQNNETLVVQFGDVADDNHGFWFKFANLIVSKYVYPLAYEPIDFVAQDDNKYTPLDYIESTAAARDNAFTTTYKAKASTEVDIKFNIAQANGWQAIFCGRNGSDAGNGISLYINGNNNSKFGYFVGGYRNDDFTDFPGFNQDITVEASLSGLVVNGGEKVNTNQTSFNSSSRGISMFANPEHDQPIRGRIYYMTIKEDGTTIYDFQPVMRHDGAYGYYDRKTATFIMPKQGHWTGYGYKKLTDEAYVTYNTDIRIVMVGSTAKFLPEVQNIEGATFTWSSSDETKATVAADGTVTGVAAGKVIITATTDADDGWTASYELTVSEPDYKRYDANNVGYAIVTGGNGWGDSPLSALLDNDANTKFGCSEAGDAWAIIIASEQVAVKQYSIVTGADTYKYPARNPVSWKLEGSNDNQTWTLIDEKDQTYQLKSFNKYENVIEVNGTETYKFFKFSATKLGGGFQLGEFWINEQTHNFADEQEVLYGPTCTTDGKSANACTDCGTAKIESIPAIGHNYANGICSNCNGKVSELVLLPTRGSDNKPYTVKFRHANGVSTNEYEDIETGWADADFDDSAWDELMMPVGNFGPYHTYWHGEHNTFWFRRSFYVSDPSSVTKLTLKVTHDDDCAVFLNGKKVWNEFDWTSNENDWRTVDIDPADLVAGKNVLAMYIEQNSGGRYCDFGLEAQVAAPVYVTDALYATFVAPFDVDFTGADVSAFAAQTNLEKGFVHLEPVTTVPAGTAVVVKAEAEGEYFAPKTTDAVLGTTNNLQAALVEFTADGSQFILSKPEGEPVGFYRCATDDTINPGKGYLVITSTTGGEVKSFYGFDPDATSINGVNFAGENAPIYNVAGQRMSKMQKGINIVGNKKVLK